VFSIFHALTSSCKSIILAYFACIFFPVGDAVALALDPSVEYGQLDFTYPSLVSCFESGVRSLSDSGYSDIAYGVDSRPDNRFYSINATDGVVGLYDDSVFVDFDYVIIQAHKKDSSNTPSATAHVICAGLGNEGVLVSIFVSANENLNLEYFEIFNRMEAYLP
jgi:hypothetical protein